MMIINPPFVRCKGSNLAKPWPFCCLFEKRFRVSPAFRGRLGRFLADLNLSKMEDQEQLERVAVGSGGEVGASIRGENLEIHILKLIHNRSLGETMGPPEHENLVGTYMPLILEWSV